VRKIVATLIGVSAITAIACSSAPNEATDADVSRLNEHANNKQSSTPVASPKPKLITGGDWEIGNKEDIGAGVITPGTYIITVPESGYGCYYETVKDFEQKFDSIIANGNVDPGQTARVVVKKSYAGLSLKGDCLATKKK
jgi:hypothetical protein